MYRLTVAPQPGSYPFNGRANTTQREMGSGSGMGSEIGSGTGRKFRLRGLQYFTAASLVQVTCKSELGDSGPGDSSNIPTFPELIGASQRIRIRFAACVAHHSQDCDVSRFCWVSLTLYPAFALRWPWRRKHKNTAQKTAHKNT